MAGQPEAGLRHQLEFRRPARVRKRLRGGCPLSRIQKRAPAAPDAAWAQRGGDSVKLSADLSAGALAGSAQQPAAYAESAHGSEKRFSQFVGAVWIHQHHGYHFLLSARKLAVSRSGGGCEQA